MPVMKTGINSSLAKESGNFPSTQSNFVMQNSEPDVAEVLAGMVDERYTTLHMSRVAWLSVQIGATLGFSEHRLAGLRLGAQLHDVGKFAIPTEILTKAAQLSEPEFEVMKQHPQTGYDLVRRFSWSWPVPDMVVQHHERIDGSGYPHGLRGPEILPEAKIIAIADVVDAMLSNRPYRAALPKQHIVDELTIWRGTHYDTATVDACLDVLMSFEIVAYAFGLGHGSEPR
jgi:HD-GYP domain-containing protein (c-di-GMP phosphodiesterase class II)